MNWLQAAIRDELPSAIAGEQRGSPLRSVPFSTGRETDPEEVAHEEFMRGQQEMGAFQEDEEDPASEKVAALDDLERAVDEAVPALEALLAEVSEKRIKREQVPQAVVDILDDILDFYGIDPIRLDRRGRLPDRVALVRRYLQKENAVLPELRLKEIVRRVFDQAGLGWHEDWNSEFLSLPRLHRPLGIPPSPPPPHRLKTEQEKREERQEKAHEELMERVRQRDISVRRMDEERRRDAGSQ